MAQHKVLRPFPFAEDGVNTRDVAADETIEVSASAAPGLIAEGYIADGGAAETLSKVAGEAMVATDLAGTVDSDKAVKEEAAQAKAGISDGKIGAPEAATIVDAHKLTDLSSAADVQAAQDEKAAHEAGDADFDPKSTDAAQAAQEKVEDGKSDPFDHDGDGEPGGAPKGGNRKKS